MLHKQNSELFRQVYWKIWYNLIAEDPMSLVEKKNRNRMSNGDICASKALKILGIFANFGDIWVNMSGSCCSGSRVDDRLN